MSMNRRDFLKTGAMATLATGVGARTRVGLAAPRGATDDVLLVVFLRGAMDGLSLVPPIDGDLRTDYELARSATRIPASGANAALPLANSGGLWGLHPRASGLHSLYQDGKLAVIHAVGMVHQPVSRSHFDAQAFMEYGLNGRSGSEGWLTRHLASAGLPPEVAIPAVSAGAITAASLLASTETITMASGSEFRLNTGDWAWRNAENTSGNPGFADVLPSLWQGSELVERKGRQALDALEQIENVDFSAYVPGNGVTYPSTSFASQLKMLATLIRHPELGLRVATVDYGGWDTHNGQGNPGQSYDWFGNLTQTLSEGLFALCSDLDGSHLQRVNVIVMSEFGRRVLENDAGGTDHGYGNVWLALGGAVNGGRTFGDFPGLDRDHLFERADVTVTTDYRHVLAEAMNRRLGNPNVHYVFPEYPAYTPLGIFQGTDLPPSNYDSIFADGFD